MTKAILKILYIQRFPVLEKCGIMSTLVVKTLRLIKAFYTKTTYVGTAIALLLILYACSTPVFNVTDITWKTYKNARYGFEFPYPSNWNALATPTNADGVVLVSPKRNSVEIRAWASNQLIESPTSEKDNFQTSQGLTGILGIEANDSVSSMTLTLTQNQVKYSWQGRSPSQEFPNYYPLFYYIAQQYRISR
ncbi:hypothetical protein [Nostoc parmelioides]|uniref:Uncharacterized protein n=1 Tax=Nostoc parmelioides FACHB-3921 TaxID=2692909 RepID=A0ABR8BLG6_9NOSO|nr:hypothetical protein [Nostoc parmelioides]MBD2253631.1 hypothetical protein [Nostoc parmelioides FACHB-3921]